MDPSQREKEQSSYYPPQKRQKNEVNVLHSQKTTQDGRDNKLTLSRVDASKSATIILCKQGMTEEEVKKANEQNIRTIEMMRKTFFEMGVAKAKAECDRIVIETKAECDRIIIEEKKKYNELEQRQVELAKHCNKVVEHVNSIKAIKPTKWLKRYMEYQPKIGVDSLDEAKRKILAQNNDKDYKALHKGEIKEYKDTENTIMTIGGDSEFVQEGDPFEIKGPVFRTNDLNYITYVLSQRQKLLNIAPEINDPYLGGQEMRVIEIDDNHGTPLAQLHYPLLFKIPKIPIYLLVSKIDYNVADCDIPLNREGTVLRRDVIAERLNVKGAILGHKFIGELDYIAANKINKWLLEGIDKKLKFNSFQELVVICREEFKFTTDLNDVEADDLILVENGFSTMYGPLAAWHLCRFKFRFVSDNGESYNKIANKNTTKFMKALESQYYNAKNIKKLGREIFDEFKNIISSNGK